MNPLAALGQGFYGGLALDAGAGLLYAIASDGFSSSTLYRMAVDGSGLTALGALTSGAYGGLAFNANNGRLYALGADEFGVVRNFDEIDLSAMTSAELTLFLLGDGSMSHSGGLAHDAAADLFYAIGNDFFANSSLVSFDTTGAGSLTPVGAGLGQGYLNAGLARAPDDGGGPVPEPPMPALQGLALGAAFLAARRPARRPTQLVG